MNFITFLTITNFFFLTFNIHQYLHECKLFSACKHYFWTYAGTCFLKQDGGESISKSPYGISGRALAECTPSPTTTTTTSTTFSKSFVILMLSKQSFYNTVFCIFTPLIDLIPISRWLYSDWMLFARLWLKCGKHRYKNKLMSFYIFYIFYKIIVSVLTSGISTPEECSCYCRRTRKQTFTSMLEQNSIF